VRTSNHDVIPYQRKTVKLTIGIARRVYTNGTQQLRAKEKQSRPPRRSKDSLKRSPVLNSGPLGFRVARLSKSSGCRNGQIGSIANSVGVTRSFRYSGSVVSHLNRRNCRTRIRAGYVLNRTATLDLANRALFRIQKSVLDNSHCSSI
jgi:hypothetical protein